MRYQENPNDEEDVRLLFNVLKKIERRSKNYTQNRVTFDTYKLNSLKNKTQGKRATNSPTDLNYHVNDNMSIAALSLKDLLSSNVWQMVC